MRRLSKEQRRALRLKARERSMARRAWVGMVLWGGMGHLLALAVSVPLFGVLFMSVGFAALRPAVVAQLGSAALLNAWYHWDTVRVHRARERDLVRARRELVRQYARGG